MIFNKKESIKNLIIPTHIAIIMDGNARWAKSKKLTLHFGHKIGAQNIEKVAKTCIEFNVKYLTVYAFSSENWERPKEEVEYLMNLLDEYLEKDKKELIENNIKVIFSGNLDKLSQKTIKKIENIEDISKNNTKLTLNVAFSYGGREEIVRATKKTIIDVLDKKVSIDEIDEEFFSKKLYCPEIPDPDLVIRTAGDFRLSNFLLWQSAYSELYFTNIAWPNFNRKDLLKAIKEFNKRERRYGKR